MSHLCTCGHQPDEHTGDKGRCEGQCIDYEYGQFTCLCYGYERDDHDG